MNMTPYWPDWARLDVPCPPSLRHVPRLSPCMRSPCAPIPSALPAHPLSSARPSPHLCPLARPTDSCRCQVLLNTSTGVYASFVMTVVAQEDASRPIWPSCPARGWASGVEKLTSLPVPGATLVPHLLKEHVIETHGPYATLTPHGTPRQAPTTGSHPTGPHAHTGTSTATASPRPTVAMSSSRRSAARPSRSGSHRRTRRASRSQTSSPLSSDRWA
jgi:hypothetical protein